MPPVGPYQTRVIADGASNYWPLDDPSGTVARDLAGSAPGTISGGVTINQPGVTAASKSMTFDGASGKIVTAATVALPFPLTVEVWFRTSLTGETSFFGTLATSGSGFGIALSGANLTHYYVSYADLTIQYFDVPHGLTFVPTQWNQLVVTVTNPTVTTYINGVAGTPITLPKTLNGAIVQRVCIPEQGAIYGTWFAGGMQDVAIYPLALTPAQVAAHYALQLAPPGAFSGRGPIANLPGKVTATNALDISTTVALADATRTGHLDGPTKYTDAVLIPAPAADEQIVVTALSASVLVAGPFSVRYRTGAAAVLGPIWLPSSGPVALVSGRTFETGPILRALPPGQGLTVTTSVDAPQAFDAEYQIVGVA